MHSRPKRLALLALVLALIFIGGQLHLCSDLTAAAGSISSHVCPVCSAAASIVAPQALAIRLIPVSSRVEFRHPRLAESPDVCRTISPRAPPALDLAG